MKTLVSLILVNLLAGCASTGHRPASTRINGVSEEARKLAMETKRYEEADVRGEVETRLHAGDLRFKGWQEKISDTIVTLPGISQEEGRKLEGLKLPAAEVLFCGTRKGVRPSILRSRKTSRLGWTRQAWLIEFGNMSPIK